MKISYNWLKTLINVELQPNEAADFLTACGLEVEGIEAIESIKGGLKGLVVGEVKSCEKHPDADRLSLTKIDIGTGEILSIVCGAPNVAAGQKVIVATVGTQLFPVTGEPFEIKKSKIRGAASEGMLCAEDEIGLGIGHDGILVLPVDTKVGLSAADYFKVENDTILEIGLTPNRSDAASHLGVARDLAAILKSKNENSEAKAEIPKLIALGDATGTHQITIDLKNTEGCKRYSGLLISGVRVKESPDWIKNRLQAIGVRPINNIVDITNYVLHELGQPLHAFDAEKIKGKKVIIRSAVDQEKFIGLDGLERKLSSEDLVICDESSAMCLAGVFGGSESGVKDSTTSIFLESAYFEPAFVRRTAKRHALKTDASFRFERGTDPEMTVIALQRCANLILENAGGVLSMNVTDLYTEQLEPYKVAFSFANCRALIGKEIDRATIRNIITSLGMVVETEGNDGLLLSVPRFKTDVTREADIIEEVLRIYGYNNVEVSKEIAYSSFNSPKNFNLNLENRVGSLLEGFGFNEMIGLSLTSDQYYSEGTPLVKVVNPLSNDLNVMRADLMYGGLETLAHNINRKNADLKFYEIGKTYQKKTSELVEYQEDKHLTLFVTGKLFAQNPYGLNQEADLTYLKSVMENLFNKAGLTKFTYLETEDQRFEFGLNCMVNNKVIASLGSVKKKNLKQFDISQPVLFADIHWDLFLKTFTKQKSEYTELSKFPSVRRDLALLIDRSVKFQEIHDLAFGAEKKFLQEVQLFDIYEGEKLGDKKSYAVSFTLLNKEATLTDKQIDGVMDKLISTYKEKIGAELR